MTRYIALLRGINVGGHRRLAMADLRTALTGLGYTEVTTYLQSGNAVFTTQNQSNLETEIETALDRECGIAVPVVIRTADELREVIENNPLEVTDPARFLVSFVSAPLDPDLLKDIDPASYAPEKIWAGERELYYSLPNGTQKAKLPQILGRVLDTPATARNWNTVTKLSALADG